MAGGPAPSSCPGSDPEIFVTVTGSSGTIAWLGETWFLDVPTNWQATTNYAVDDRVSSTTPGVNSYKCTTAGTSGGSEPSWDTTLGNTTNDGTVVWERVVTTDSGVQKTVCPTSYALANTTTVFTVGHTWINNQGATDQLRVGRFGVRGYTTMYSTTNQVEIRDGFTALDNLLKLGPSTQTLVTGNVGLLTVGSPSIITFGLANVSITDDFFGSYVTGGITYTWSRGNGWP